jgi:hypothetical protein
MGRRGWHGGTVSGGGKRGTEGKERVSCMYDMCRLKNVLPRESRRVDDREKEINGKLLFFQDMSGHLL